LFSVTVDDLLSGEELLTIAEEDQKQKELYVQDLVFGLLDLSVAMFLFLPFFGQKAEGAIQAVSLLSLTGVTLHLKIVYFVVVVAIVLSGILTLALQNCRRAMWVNYKRRLSLGLHAAGALLFIISLQPYAAGLLFVFFLIKVLTLIKKP